VAYPETDNDSTEHLVYPSFSEENLSYTPQIYEIADHLWIAVGYESTNSVLIEGDDGIIVIDTLTSYDSAKKLLKDFREISYKPVKVIIYTQENSDLVNGAQAFLEEGDGSVEIITHEDQSNYFVIENNLNVQPTHTYSSEFLINVTGIEMTLIHNNGLFSDQTYVFLPDNDGMLIADGISGVLPFILDVSFIQDYFSN